MSAHKKEEPELLSKPIALIGLMGAGKTTYGKLLGAHLGCPFIDTDSEIERSEGRSIANIFTEKGEGYFRAVEKKIVAGALDGRGKVLSLGGGALMDADTAALVFGRAVTIWLTAGTDILARRVGADKNRPLLHNTNIQERLDELFKSRAATYARADITIDTSGKKPEVLNAMIEAIKTHLQHD